MSEMSKGSRYRCVKEGCGMEVQVTEDCRCGDECHLTCCGEKMQRK